MLYLYNGISPNLNGTHYYFTSVSDYETKLLPKLVTSVSLTNYRINSNTIKVSLDTTLTEAKADTITYAIEDRGTYFRAWHVKNVQIQSGMAIYECSVDLWATYLLKAKISNLVVTRCNRNLGVGYLDDLMGTTGAPSRGYCAVTGRSSGSSNELYDISKVYIVFALKYNIEQTTAGSASRIRLMAFNLLTLKTGLFHALGDTFGASIVNPVEFAMDVVSGIYGIVGTNVWGILGTLDAAIIGAWFTDDIATIGQDAIQVKTKTGWSGYNDIVLTPLEVIRSEYSLSLSVTNDFNKQFYIGTMANGLKLHRTTETTISVTIRCIISNDKLSIYVQQGDNQDEITDAFSITLGMTDGDISAERQFQNIFKNSIRFIGSGLAVAKGFSSGNPLAMVMGAQGLAGAIAGSTDREQHMGNAIKGGDGALAYYRVFTGSDQDNPANNLTTPITNPYVINAYASVDDEKSHARIYGARFNAHTTLASVFASTLLGTGSFTDTFVKGTCIVSEAPSDACELIRSKIAGGIYLEKLGTP